MLVISRKVDEKIKIGKDIEIVIVEVDKNQVKLGIKAPKHITILRNELIEEIKKENKKATKKIDINLLKNITKNLKGKNEDQSLCKS